MADMREDPGQDLSALDDGALQDLKDDAGEAVARAFIEEYLLMLPARAAKIVRALTREDTVESLDAVVSLRTSSAMAGALRLESYCRDLERGLKRGHSPDVTAVTAGLFSNIRQVIREASRRGHLPPRSQDSHS
ncbi:Hpt domain-containing protein [Arthrobacter sp. ISL-65]|uniref:Hpt domain-containing protein n=1 Tax=Arthrobacter sp. ISL-65 TaxID=2819112 RepID=UPI001BE7EBAA|nr:Hpt domain-containing protein [Arthrobacter sp. ISL-65]MBT2548030.1 Hpt domain-containing protein [Arthrobacter sp. ISL-65]